MTCQFQELRPLIQADFDKVMGNYPEDMSSIHEKVPFGGNPLTRKLAIINTAAQLCPLHLLPHYPFSLEISVGQPRTACHAGLGEICRNRSGVDFSPLHQLRQQIWESNLGSFNDYTDFLHSTIDFDLLLEKGFSGIYQDCEILNRSESDPEKIEWRQCVMQVCLAVRDIQLRFRRICQERFDSISTDLEQNLPVDMLEQENLHRILTSQLCPWAPPTTYFEAMWTIMYASICISRLDGINMSCQGPLDRLLQPYYERDLQAGRLTQDEAYSLLQCFLFRTDAHVHYSPERTNYDNGVTVMIGGLAPDGSHVYNAITDMILDAYTENRFIQPKLNARAAKDSPQPYLRRLADLMLTGSNNLIVENDDYIVPMFERMGLDTVDARRYIGGGCQEVICPNQVHSRAFVYLNMPQILLDTMQYGYRSTTEQVTANGIPETMSDAKKHLYRYGRFQIETFDQFYAAFLTNLRSYIQVIAETFRPFEKQHYQIQPVPLLSCFSGDCVSRGLDMANNGARYNHKTLSLVGFGTLCDSFLRIRESFASDTLNELQEAVSTNFASKETMRQNLLHAKHKFGSSDEGDLFARQLAQDLANVSEGIYNANGIRWHTSLFTYYLFKNLGNATGATPDGRLSNTSFSRQMNMATLPALTTAARSMANLTDADFHDVGMFDIALPLHTGGMDADVLANYIRTCLDMRLPVLQTNVFDVSQLQEEMENKGTHPDLVVRVCGYSALFTELGRSMQEEILARIR